MWEVPDKYNTRCYLQETGELISEHQYEAINESEAEARAFLNCVNINNKKRNIRVTVEKVSH